MFIEEITWMLQECWISFRSLCRRQDENLQARGQQVSRSSTGWRQRWSWQENNVQVRLTVSDTRCEVVCLCKKRAALRVECGTTVWHGTGTVAPCASWRPPWRRPRARGCSGWQWAHASRPRRRIFSDLPHFVIAVDQLFRHFSVSFLECIRMRPVTDWSRLIKWVKQEARFSLCMFDSAM